MTLPSLIQEDHINATENYMLGEPIRMPVEDTVFDSVGDIYRGMQREYGRCTGKVYVDREGGPVQVGWVFLKRDKYEDTGETFLHETWVTLLSRYEKKVEIEHFAIGRG